MEDLLRSLRNLGLEAPNVSQLWQLLDEDEQVQQRLIKLLAFNAVDVGTGEGDTGETVSASALMGQDLLQEAVAALLDNFRQSIKRQRDTHKRECQALNKEQPKDSDGKVANTKRQFKLPPKKALLARHEALMRKQLEQEQEDKLCKKRYRPKLVYDGDVSFCSTVPVDQLRAITCSDLDGAPKRLTGAFLPCRVITTLILYVGVTFLIEDVKGDVIPVSVSHFTNNVNLTMDEVSNLLPKGTIIAIREPFISLDHQARAGPCSGKANVGIRVDSPTDIVVLPSESYLLKGMKWLEPEEACEQNGKGTTTPALPWLRHDLDSAAHEHANVSYAQRAESLHHAKRQGAALRMFRRAQGAGEDVDTLLEARILFALCAWRQAEEKFIAIAKSDTAESDDDQADWRAANDFSLCVEQLSPTQAAKRCAARQLQETQGLTVNDVRSIHFAAPNTARFDTADYVGPVRVEDVPGEGRGLITTRDVEPGELLLCCRAVGAAYPDDKECLGSPIVRLNLDNGVASATSQVRAQTNLIHAVVDRPELAHAVLGLTAGPSISYSSYASMNEYPMRTKAVLDVREDDQLISVDAQYVDGVLRFNAFGPARGGSDTASGIDAEIDAGELSKSTMPHPLPAILNHACLPNVASIFFSNIVTSRALVRMPRGTQIVHQYVRGEEPYAIRAAQLSKHAFTCACTLCQADRNDGQEAYTQRARIIQGELGAVQERSRMLMKRVSMARVGCSDALKDDDEVEAHRDVLGSLLQLVARVNKTYAATRGALRPDVFIILQLALKHLTLIDTTKAEEMLVEAIACVGGTLDLSKSTKDEKDGKTMLTVLPRLHLDGAIALLLLMAVVHTNTENVKCASAYMQAAYVAHQCMIGGGIDVFCDRWKNSENDVAFTSFHPA